MCEACSGRTSINGSAVFLVFSRPRHYRRAGGRRCRGTIYECVDIRGMVRARATHGMRLGGESNPPTTDGEHDTGGSTTERGGAYQDARHSSQVDGSWCATAVNLPMEGARERGSCQLAAPGRPGIPAPPRHSTLYAHEHCSYTPTPAGGGHTHHSPRTGAGRGRTTADGRTRPSCPHARGQPGRRLHDGTNTFNPQAGVVKGRWHRVVAESVHPPGWG